MLPRTPTLFSGFWADASPSDVAHPLLDEKLVARLRWLAFAIWVGHVALSQTGAFRHTGLLLCAVGGGLYCLLGQYVAYRCHAGRPLRFPIGLTDVAFVAGLCAVSGGLSSPVYLYFYGLVFMAARRFGLLAGLGMGLACGVASVPLGLSLDLTFPSAASLSSTFLSLALRFGLFLGVVGLAPVLTAGLPVTSRKPEAVPDRSSTGQLDHLREVLATSDLDELLQRLVAETAKLVSCRGVCVVLFPGEEAADIRAATAGAFPALPTDAWQQTLAEGGTVRGNLTQRVHVVQTSQPLYTRLASVADTALAERQIMIHEIGHDPVLGYLLLADSSRRAVFRPDEIERVGQIALCAVHAVRSAKAFNELHRSVGELRNLLQTRLDAHEDELGRVAGALRDLFEEKLFRIVQDFRGFQQFVIHYAPDGRERCERLAAELDEIVSLGRRLSDELRPPALGDAGFVETLRSYVTQRQAGQSFEVVVAADGAQPRLPLETRRRLFRIVQVALQSIQRHTRASRVQIALKPEGSDLSLVITDNSRGLWPAPDPVGLIYMREQAVAGGGRFSVDRQQGSGTEIRVMLPLEAKTDSSKETDA